MSDEKKFERFGKYLILDHLVDGGMAKICRARYLGEQANKMVAVKMVQPQYSNDEAFVRMFQDELNITFGMLHPNIMQVYDYGKTNGQLYTAMEYIHGADLKKFLDRLKENNKAFPVEATCYIISQVCLGLHYAHTFTDKLTGKPYNVVHRDISPHNIMLTYDGAVKVIDFGIAKANTNSESTQAGTIKGKLSYLAPEYLEGMELDCRYDEFAVGITMWEMLCGRKLFQANNDLAVLKLIQQCKIIPPSEINKTVPKELDEIVLKALSKDRANRYENLDQMNRALVRFLYSNYPEWNPSDLRGFADNLFGKEIKSDQEKFVSYGSIDIQPFIEDLKREESKTGKTTRKQAGLKDKTVVREKVRELDLMIDEGSAVNIEVETVEKTSTRRFNRSALDSSSNEPITTNTKGARILPSSGRSEKTSNKSVIKKQAIASKNKKKSNSVLILIIAASLAGVFIFKDRLLGPELNSDRNPAADKEGNRLPVSGGKKVKPVREQSGQVILTGLDMSMEIYLNNMKYEYTGRPIKVELNKESTITIKKAGFRNFTTKVTLNAERDSFVLNIPDLERTRVGLLSTTNKFPAGSKLVYEEDGAMIERNLPFDDVSISEGVYQGRIVNPILGTEKRVEFTIEENKKHFLE